MESLETTMVSADSSTVHAICHFEGRRQSVFLPTSRTDLSEVRGFLMNSVLETRAENWVEGCLGNLGQGSGLGLRVALAI